MDRFLYILSEGERDDFFYERIVEHVTGERFSRPADLTYRRGDNWKTVLQLARMSLNKFKHWTEKQPVCLIIAVDNDRSPGHPAGRVYPRPLPPMDLKKTSRWHDLHAMIHNTLGPEPGSWPISLAVAMPVEMIESWLLALMGYEEGDQPPFADADSASARQYYGGNPLPQLKDLVRKEAAARGLSADELYLTLPVAGIPDAAGRNGSLKLFVQSLSGWKQPPG